MVKADGVVEEVPFQSRPSPRPRASPPMTRRPPRRPPRTPRPRRRPRRSQPPTPAPDESEADQPRPTAPRRRPRAPLKKGIYAVSSLAELLCRSVARDRPLGGRVGEGRAPRSPRSCALARMGAAILVAMTQEEADELSRGEQPVDCGARAGRHAASSRSAPTRVRPREGRRDHAERDALQKRVDELSPSRRAGEGRREGRGLEPARTRRRRRGRGIAPTIELDPNAPDLLARGDEGRAARGRSRSAPVAPPARPAGPSPAVPNPARSRR
jgi:hypothetical protein